MAATNRKTKTTPARAKLHVVASPVAAFKATVIPALLGMAKAKGAQHDAGESTRGVIKSAIVDLRAALPDLVKYDAAIVELLGNGEKGKAHLPGSIVDSIPTAQRLSMRVTLSEARKLARWVEDPKNAAALPELSFREAMKKAAPPKTEPKAGKVDHSEREPGEAVSLEQLIARDVVGAMQIIAKILNANKQTKTQAAACAALAMQISP
jgi:hypothetical protein